MVAAGMQSNTVLVSVLSRQQNTMQWNDLKAAGEIVVLGASYDLTHLRNKTHNWVIPAANGHNELNFNALIQFGSHCVSEGPPMDSSFDFGELGEDCRLVDERGIHRKFCPDRHRLSKHLPEIFRTLMERKCRFTNHDNFMIVEMTNESGAVEKYEIFFNVYRGSASFVRIYVESGYVRDAARGGGSHSKGYRKSIKGKVLLAKKIRQEQIIAPPK